ncbi:hypothetical protein EYF80_019485 [Liparis tanakae]|uniref:Uncharacterized protein n=1 Tax=Liparis tanakae TaxID=230148 RepID=A0A4Z2HXH7_9TELE|nr:hypothetical protein EYF80_019485 [Liparis tanakae]
MERNAAASVCYCSCVGASGQSEMGKDDLTTPLQNQQEGVDGVIDEQEMARLREGSLDVEPTDPVQTGPVHLVGADVDEALRLVSGLMGGSQ